MLLRHVDEPRAVRHAQDGDGLEEVLEAECAHTSLEDDLLVAKKCAHNGLADDHTWRLRGNQLVIGDARAAKLLVGVRRRGERRQHEHLEVGWRVDSCGRRHCRACRLGRHGRDLHGG